jgi:hypothetical protein
MTRFTPLLRKRLTAFITLTIAISFWPLPAATTQEPLNLAYSDQTASGAPASPKTNAADDDKWHLAISPYLWFAGAHGTIGAGDRTASFHATAGEVLSKLNIGLMGAAEVRKRRFVAPVDVMWIKLSDDKALPESPFPGLTSVKAKVTETIFTPKAGYRILDSPTLQVDALVGLRYVHLGQDLSFQPSGLLGNYSQAANFVDVVEGAKISMALSSKASVTIFGDAGGAQADVDYQVGGFLGYKVKPTILLGAGWRYMDVNYRPSSGFIYDAAQTGLLIGVTIDLK